MSVGYLSDESFLETLTACSKELPCTQTVKCSSSQFCLCTISKPLTQKDLVQNIVLVWLLLDRFLSEGWSFYRQM